MSQTNWIEDFKENVLHRFEENTRMVSIAFAKVEDGTLWQKTNSVTIPLGNQILHVSGNITQYVISSVGDNPDKREREAEFAAEEGYTADELLQKLLLTVATAKTIISEAAETELLRKRDVQGFHLSGMGCIIHAVEHFSYHTGQIAFQVKQSTDEMLGFYDGMDLNITTEE